LVGGRKALGVGGEPNWKRMGKKKKNENAPGEKSSQGGKEAIFPGLKGG